jgi:hypothetical protein
MFFVPEKSSSAVRKAERGCRSTRAFGIREPRSHQEKACRIRDDLDGVVERELTVVFVQILSGLSHEERELEKRRGPGRGERAHRPGWLDAVKRQAAPNVTHLAGPRRGKRRKRGDHLLMLRICSRLHSAAFKFAISHATSLRFVLHPSLPLENSKLLR